MGNLFMSWYATSFKALATGSTQIDIDEVTDVDLGLDGEQEDWYADGSIFPKLVLTQRQKRTITVSGGDVGKLLSLPWNTPGTFKTTLGDPVEGTGPGALLFVLTPCTIGQAPQKGSTGKFATGQVMLHGYAPDGITDPLSYTVQT